MNNTNTGSTKTIAKNTLYLYIRMFISMVIALFSSRLILSTLGIEDYGIYNVVGGIITLFSFLNTTMAGATSRFITYEQGKGAGNVQKVFSTSLTIHLLIALVVLIIGETFGVWFLNNKLVIPDDRMFAANILLQFSIITMLFNFTQVPYNASIIANEKMNVYAFVGMVDPALRLGIIYLISFSSWDKLIIYGFMIMIEQVGVILFYRFYCTKFLSNCRFKVLIDKAYLKPMLTYSVWDVFGQGSVVVRSQGVNMLLNMFFGAAVNAATGIATQVQTLVNNFTHNVMTAFRPQVVKNYAQGNYSRMEYLINFGATTTFLLYVMVGVPLMVEMDYVLDLWLKNVPDYCSIFARFALVSSLFGNFTAYPMMGIDATARIRDSSIIIGILYILVIPVSYIFFLNGNLSPQIPYIYNASVPFAIVFVNIICLHIYVKEISIKRYLMKVVMPCLLVFIIDILIVNIVHCLLPEGFVRLVICIIVCSLIVLLISPFTCYNKEQRDVIYNYLMNKIKRHDSK